MITCEYCEYSSNLSELFRYKSPVNRPPIKVCPGCYEKLSFRENKRTAQIILLNSIFFAIAATYDPDFGPAWIMLNLTVMWLFIGISVLVHELGHYAIAILTGGEVPLVKIGNGPLVKRIHMKNMTWEIRRRWHSGATYGIVGPPSTKTKSFLLYAAGPLSNIVIIAIIVFIITSFNQTASVTTKVNFSVDLLLANILVLMGSLSIKRPDDIYGITSDGRRMIEIITGNFSIKSDEQEQSLIHIKLNNLAFQEEHVKGVTIAEEAFQRFPNNRLFGFYNAAFMVDLGYFDKARKIIHQELEKLDEIADDFETRYHKTLFQLCLAESILLDDSNTDLVLATDLTKRCMNSIPWSPSVLYLRSLTLMAENKHQEALRLLNRSLSFETMKSLRAKIEHAIIICQSQEPLDNCI